MEKVDKTIDDICNWIQKNLEETGSMSESDIMPKMISALADLVSASAEMKPLLF